MKHLTRAGGALVLATCLIGLSGAAAYGQVRPAITQDRDQAGRNYYSAQASCNAVTFLFCGITFPTPPAGKRLIITQISMLNLLPSGQSITSIDLRYQNGNIIAFLKPYLNPGTASTFNYTVNEGVYAKFDPGEIPQLLTFVSTNANIQMVGIIAGYMIDIP